MYTNLATAVIPINDTTSGIVTLANLGIAGAIQTPAALTGTALSFLVSLDGTTFTALYATGGTLISYTVAASRVIPLDPAVFGAFPFLKLVSGSTELAARTFIIYIRAG
jgi:hypothetical protein